MNKTLIYKIAAYGHLPLIFIYSLPAIFHISTAGPDPVKGALLISMFVVIYADVIVMLLSEPKTTVSTAFRDVTSFLFLILSIFTPFVLFMLWMLQSPDACQGGGCAGLGFVIALGFPIPVLAFVCYVILLFLNNKIITNKGVM